MTPLQSATEAAESYLQSQGVRGMPAADILVELVIEAYEKAGGTAAEIERLTRERDEARETNRSLNRVNQKLQSDIAADRHVLAEHSGDFAVPFLHARKKWIVTEKSNAELREEILALNVNDEELLRQRNRCETGGSYIKIWNVWLQRLIDHERGLRMLARAALSKPEGDGK